MEFTELLFAVDTNRMWLKFFCDASRGEKEGRGDSHSVDVGRARPASSNGMCCTLEFKLDRIVKIP